MGFYIFLNQAGGKFAEFYISRKGAFGEAVPVRVASPKEKGRRIRGASVFDTLRERREGTKKYKYQRLV